MSLQSFNVINRGGNILIYVFVSTVLYSATSSVQSQNSDGNGLQDVLTELEKISTSLKSIEAVNKKLITNLRDNATAYGFKNRNPDDYIKRGYSCISGVGWYKFYQNNLTWNEARKSCRKDDAHLVILNSENEAKALKNLLLENYQFSAYIGIHNQFKEDEWVTVFGDPLAETGYNRWSVGPPKISEANCGVLFEDGKLLGIPCHAERSYFCEIPGMPAC